MYVRDSSGFAQASHQSQALCLGTLGASGLLMPVAVWGFDSLWRFGAGWAAALAGAWLMYRARQHWALHNAGLSGGGALDPELIPSGGGSSDVTELYHHGHLHEDIARLLKVAASQFPGKLVLDTDATELEDDGKGGRKLVSWGFKCVEPGFLTDLRTHERLQKTFAKSVGGFWSFTSDPRNDTFGGSRKSSIPKLVFPPFWPVVSTVEEAKQNYTGWEFKVGVSARGEEGVCPEKMPHVMCIGETGSGKSVAVRAWLEQFRTAGWQLILADGKGADYAGYFAPHAEDNNLPVPGTVAVGLGATARGMPYVAAVVLAYQILQERQSGSMDAKIADPAGWNNFIPVLLVMDEIKGMREKWRGSLSKAESDLIESMVTEILALGRELRVHVLLVSQDARAVSIPNTWKSNVPMSICLGKPGDLTLKYGFPETVRHKVRLITDSMDPKGKGRCVIASVDDKSGATDATEYQGYLGYSPGESWNNAKLPPQTKEHWPAFKTNVSDKVPRLYTRQWFMIEEKSEAQLAAESKGAPDRGFIDFDLFTVEEIKGMDRVALDMRGPDGKIVPDPAMAKYDPSSAQYVCRPPAGTHKAIKADL